jgi:hypothetical protein
MRITAAGTLPITMHAIIDRTGDVAKDRMQFDCRGLVLPQMQLGKPGKLCLAVAPSVGSINMNIVLEGDALTGKIEFVQQNVQFTPQIGGPYADLHLDQTLGETLRRMDSLAASIDLSGTLETPQWELSSSLGPAVADAVGQALARVLQDKSNELVLRSRQTVDEQLAKLDQIIAEKQASLAPKIAGASDELKKFVGGIAGPGGITFEQLGRQLPVNSLFR